MKATTQELKSFLGITSTASDGQIGVALEDAALDVVRDGVSETHSEFARLHKLRAASLLPQGFSEKFRELNSKSIGDVSYSYGNSAQNNSGSMVNRYREALTAIVGREHSIQ